MNSFAASKDYRSSCSLERRQCREEGAARARKCLLEYLSELFKDTRHLQFYRVGRNVEFVSAPQHGTSCGSAVGFTTSRTKLEGDND